MESYTAKRIDTVPAAMHEHLFGTRAPETAVSDPRLDRIQLPPLKGKDIEEHIYTISEKQAGPYRRLLDEVERWSELPKRPKQWTRRMGWTRYGRDGEEAEEVPYPLERGFVFDVETCVTEGQLPTLAVAVSGESWYSWCSRRVCDPSLHPPISHATKRDLIPLGGAEEERMAIGHNVGYDRVRTREPYERKPTRLRFWDTMAVSIPLFGISDQQTLVYKSNDLNRQLVGDQWRDAWKARVSENSLAAVHKHLYGERGTTMDKSYQKFFLIEPMERIVEEFQRLTTYCADDVLATHEIFVRLMPRYRESFPHPATMAGTLHVSNAYLPVNQNWLRFFDRAETDTHEINRKAIHSVVKAANIEAKRDRKAPDAFLWTEDWKRSGKHAFPVWFGKLFKSKADAGRAYELGGEDRTAGRGYDLTMKSNLIPLIFGLCYGPYPLFHKRDRGWGFLVPNKQLLQKERNSGQTLVKLSTGEEVVFPSGAIRDLVEREGLVNGDLLLEEFVKRKGPVTGTCDFYQMPHPDGKGNVGFPMGKHFKGDVEQKVIRPTRHTELFEAYVKALEQTLFWKQFRDRFKDELPVWCAEDTVADVSESSADPHKEEGVIAPSICPAGTVTRRSVHKLWVTATNASEGERIGTGIKNMVQAHEGFLLVGADVDSQEQWIAALYGDASAEARKGIADRRAGVTPFSNMMLAGSKSDGSDLHSVVARNLGISRHSAKVLNYARLYGSGENHSVEELEKGGVRRSEAIGKATQLFALTKGTRSSYRLLKQSVGPEFEAFLKEHKLENAPGYVRVGEKFFVQTYMETDGHLTTAFEDWHAERVKRAMEREGRGSEFSKFRVVASIYEDETKETKLTLYSGGYESDTFNYLEVAATQQEIRTPVLGARLGSSLSPLPADTPDRDNFAKKYKRSLINWLVQSSAVDFLHLLLVVLQDFIDDYGIRARFAISIHDEVRYVVRNEDADRFALALMLANLYVRAFFSARVGIAQLPMSCAFFSQVDLDTVLRKEVDAKCVNPDGTLVPNGKALNIYDVIEATGGSLKVENLNEHGEIRIKATV